MVIESITSERAASASASLRPTNGASRSSSAFASTGPPPLVGSPAQRQRTHLPRFRLGFSLRQDAERESMRSRNRTRRYGNSLFRPEGVLPSGTVLRPRQSMFGAGLLLLQLPLCPAVPATGLFGSGIFSRA